MLLLCVGKSGSRTDRAAPAIVMKDLLYSNATMIQRQRTRTTRTTTTTDPSITFYADPVSGWNFTFCSVSGTCQYTRASHKLRLLPTGAGLVES
jgi:hypothetical protein